MRHVHQLIKRSKNKLLVSRRMSEPVIDSEGDVHAHNTQNPARFPKDETNHEKYTTSRPKTGIQQEKRFWKIKVKESIASHSSHWEHNTKQRWIQRPWKQQREWGNCDTYRTDNEICESWIYQTSPIFKAPKCDFRKSRKCCRTNNTDWELQHKHPKKYFWDYRLKKRDNRLSIQQTIRPSHFLQLVTTSGIFRILLTMVQRHTARSKGSYLLVPVSKSWSVALIISLKVRMTHYPAKLILIY